MGSNPTLCARKKEGLCLPFFVLKNCHESLVFYGKMCYNNKVKEKNNRFHDMKCVFIYNPVSGKGKIPKKLDYIVKKLHEKYDEVEVRATQSSGDMANFAREAIDKVDAIIFAGGDGSFNEVLQGVADVENMPALGYIPSGTVNDIARTLKIPRNIKKALKIILNGRTAKLDCMKANDRYAMYVIAAGAFTRATYLTSQKQKNQMGSIAYFIEGARSELNFDIFNIDCKNENKEEQTSCVFVSFMNSQSVAGFRLNRTTKLQDGKIEVAIVSQKKKKGFWNKVGAILSVFKLFLFGYRAKNRDLIRLEGALFDVDVGEDVVWIFDGEKGASGKLHIEVIPQRVNMIISKKLKSI